MPAWPVAPSPALGAKGVHPAASHAVLPELSFIDVTVHKAVCTLTCSTSQDQQSCMQLQSPSGPEGLPLYLAHNTKLLPGRIHTLYLESNCPDRVTLSLAALGANLACPQAITSWLRLLSALFALHIPRGFTKCRTETARRIYTCGVQSVLPVQQPLWQPHVAAPT